MNSETATFVLATVLIGCVIASRVRRWCRSLPWCPLCRESRVLPTFEYCIACQLELY